LTATAATDTDAQRQPPRFNARDARLAAMLAVIAAVLFGTSLYATAQIGRSLPIGWAVLAPRVTGAALVAMPLAIRRRLVLTWRAAPLAVAPPPTPSPTPIPLDQALLSRRVTFLLLGTDQNASRALRHEPALTDSMIVLSINAAHNRLTMISVPRDTVDVRLPDGSVW